jgi:hypothetical protein
MGIKLARLNVMHKGECQSWERDGTQVKRTRNDDADPVDELAPPAIPNLTFSNPITSEVCHV